MMSVGNENENIPLYYHIVNNLQIQFGREELCLVTGLRFAVEYWAHYDNEEDHIPFRRRVFPSSLDGEHITGKTVETLIDSKLFDRLHDDDDVSLFCVGILQLVFLGVEGRRIVPDWILREEFCLVSGLRFGVEYWADYDNDEDPILFRRRVFPSSLDGVEGRRIVPDWILRLANDRVGWDNHYPRAAVWSKKGRFLRRMVVDFYHGNRPVARLTPDDTEARSDWWVSSRAYFDGVIDQAERGMNVGPVREANKGPVIVSQHYGISDFSDFPSNQTQANNSFFNMGTPTNWQTPMPSQPGSSNWQSHMMAQSATLFMQPAMLSHPRTYNWQSQIPSHMGNLNSQTPIETHLDGAGLLDQNIPNRGKREQRPTKYRRTPYVKQPPTTILPKQRGNKNKNKVNKAIVLPLNLENVFDDDNEGSDDIMFVGG
nr:phospholipase-like protein [Tanacetum cinerariifolium]